MLPIALRSKRADENEDALWSLCKDSEVFRRRIAAHETRAQEFSQACARYEAEQIAPVITRIRIMTCFQRTQQQNFLVEFEAVYFSFVSRSNVGNIV
jgi:hypothetical protein